MKRTVLLLAVCLVGVAGCGSPATDLATVTDARSQEAVALTDVLRQDHEIIHSLSPDASWKTDEYVRYIVANMKAIDTSECPPEFSDAYEEHVRAWQHHLRTVIRCSKEIETLTEYFQVCTLHGTPAGNDLEKSLFPSLDRIESTYDVCLRIANSYGVNNSDFR